MNLAGRFTRKTGAAGTETLPAGAVLLRVWCRSTAGGTVNIFGAGNTPVIANAAPIDLPYNHTLSIAGAGGAAATVVFTSTDSYLVEYVEFGKG